MRRLALIFAALLLAGPLHAQEAMDDSAKDMDPEKAQAITKALIDKTSDPYSAQIIRIREIDGGVCGMVNLKNTYGGYTGFQPFMLLNDSLTLGETPQCQN